MRPLVSFPTSCDTYLSPSAPKRHRLGRRLWKMVARPSRSHMYSYWNLARAAMEKTKTYWYLPSGHLGDYQPAYG